MAPIDRLICLNDSPLGSATIGRYGLFGVDTTLMEEEVLL